MLGPLLAGCVYGPPVAPLPTRPAVPVAAAPAAAVRPPATFVVQPGDGLNAVALRLEVPRQAIIDANGLKPPYGLRIGQVLRIPQVAGYRVEPGDSLNTIAQSRGVPATQLAELNHLTPSSPLRAGSEIAVPLPPAAPPPPPTYAPPPAAAYGSVPAPVPPYGTAMAPTPYPPPNPLTAPPPAPIPSSEPAVPPPAPLLPPPPSSVAGRSAFPTSALPDQPQPPASVSRPSPPVSGIAGEALAPLPGSATSTGPITSAPPPPTLPGPTAGAPVPLTPATKPAASAPAPVPPPASVASAEPPAPPKGGKTFLWPVRGKILSGFGSSSEGEKNDGINIASARGTPIVAAEGGTVVYVGNELRSFGNLMLIKHPDGWYTAYAHADSFLVKKGDTVRRGQPIGKVGNTGNAPESELHFEIRQGEKPVNPSDYLPQLNS